MAARGKAVSSAVSSGRHEITKGMRKTRSIGQDIEWWWKVSAVHIPDTKNALYRAFLDSLGEGWPKEVAVETGIQYTERDHDYRHQL